MSHTKLRIVAMVIWAAVFTLWVCLSADMMVLLSAGL